MRKERILVAEDDRTARVSLVGLLETEGFEVLSAGTGTQAQSLLTSEEPDVALLDIRMPGLDGLTILRRARESGLGTPLIVMTAHGDSNTAIEAMKSGAFDYVLKPLDFHQLLPQIQRAIEHRRLAKELNSLRTQVAADGVAATMVGRSPAMQHVYKLIGQVADSDATVLIRGESGTGRFEEANGGTLFLDEIGELAPALQSKLLRAIQERTIERLGSNAPIPVDIRLIAATSRNLEQAIEEGEFREDLYYRLNVVTIQLPPLRERRQDIPALVQHFLNRGGRKGSITPQALATLDEYHWPGNVRELENTIERALVLAREGIVTKTEIQLRAPSERISPRWTDQVPLEVGWQANVSELEKSLVERALSQAQGNKK